MEVIECLICFILSQLQLVGQFSSLHQVVPGLQLLHVGPVVLIVDVGIVFE